MGVEKKLTERAFEPRQTLLQHDKARAGEFRGQFEIHHAEIGAEIEMLFRSEGIMARRAVDMTLDVVVLILAVRHLVVRQVRDLRQLFLQRLGGRLLLLLHRRDRGLEFGDLGHQLLRGGFVLLGLGLADVLRGGVAARLRLLKLGDQRAARLVERQQLL